MKGRARRRGEGVEEYMEKRKRYWERGIRYILAFPDLCGEGVLGGFFESHGGIVSDSSFLFFLPLCPILLTLCLKVNSSPKNTQSSEIKTNTSNPRQTANTRSKDLTFLACSFQAR